MQKLHPTHYDVLDYIRQRWSPRAFSDKPVDHAQLRSLLEAARWAPSSFNGQPWKFLVATRDQPELYAKMLGCLVEQNQGWAKSAPVLMISLASTVFEKNNKPNRHALHDTGAAAAQLTLQARAFDLYVHQMAGIDAGKIRVEYELPDTIEPVSGIAIGHLGDPETLPPELKEKELAPGTRNPLGAFVFGETYGTRADLVDMK